jgi:hypothetical protein
MSLILAFLTAQIVPAIIAFLTAFWGWILAGGLALLGFMFSPALRKYTIALLAVAAILASTYYYAFKAGYESPHPVTPPACTEFAKHLVTGPATDKAIGIFKRYHLCT